MYNIKGYGNAVDCFPRQNTATKLRRIMKLMVLLLTVCGLQVTARTNAQITYSATNQSLDVIFKQVGKQYGYNFLSRAEDLAQIKRISITVSDVSIQTFMEKCLDGQPLEFWIEGQNVFVSKKKPRSDDYNKRSITEEEFFDVEGNVLDSSGIPIEGATILVKGTSKAAVTDSRGHFKISKVSNDAILIITSVGYEMKTFKLNSKEKLRINLALADNILDKAVVIAYGKTSQRFNTGNISSVSASEIEKQPISNPLLALQGRVPGLVVTQISGIPGGGIRLQIQGQNSIASGNDPLIVVDGVPFFSQIPTIGFEGQILSPTSSGSPNPSPLNFINPSDIETMEVLKDADATAIYGSRAANGAILITTKKGSPGKTSVNASLQYGFGKVPQKLEVLNSSEYLQMRREAYKNDGIAIPSSAVDLKLWDTTRSTDWQDLLIGGTANFSQGTLSFSGGGEYLQYLISGTYQKQTTVFPGDFSDKRNTVHLNVSNTSVNKRFRLQLSASYQANKAKLPAADPTLSAYFLEPVAPRVYLDDRNLNWEPNAAGNSTWTNPMAILNFSYLRSNTNNLMGNFTASYQVIAGLDIRTSLGYTQLNTDDYLPTPLEVLRPEQRITNNPNGTNRIALYGDRKISSWIIEPQINYKRAIGQGSLEALLGTTFQQNLAKATWLQGLGYASDQLMENISSASIVTTNPISYSKYTYNAVFARLTYNLSNTYLVNLTARRDGSSRFGSNNRFHNFGSVGFAWVMSNELFAQRLKRVVSYAKLRVSYGSVGNDQVGDYSYLNLYSAPIGITRPYQGTSALATTELYNPYLQWELTRKLQVGVDIGFLNDRIYVSSTYVRNRSSNQLITTSLPTTAGFTLLRQNLPALVQNKSLELSIKINSISNKYLKLTHSFNFTFPNNKVVEFPGIEKTLYTNPNNGVIVGQPIGVIKRNHFVNVSPETGEYVFLNAQGNLTDKPNSTSDRTVLINTIPKFYGGFQNELSIKTFTLSFLAQFVKQLGSGPIMFNNATTAGPGVYSSGRSNQPKTVLNRWTQKGDNASIRKYSTNLITSLTKDGYIKNSDANYSDASFVRLKNVSVSWQFPKTITKVLKLTNGSFYINGQNLITLTSFEGVDPESQTVYALPPLRVITFGIKIGL